MSKNVVITTFAHISASLSWFILRWFTYLLSNDSRIYFVRTNDLMNDLSNWVADIVASIGMFERTTVVFIFLESLERIRDIKRFFIVVLLEGLHIYYP